MMGDIFSALLLVAGYMVFYLIGRLHSSKKLRRELLEELPTHYEITLDSVKNQLDYCWNWLEEDIALAMRCLKRGDKKTFHYNLHITKQDTGWLVEYEENQKSFVSDDDL